MTHTQAWQKLGLPEQALLLAPLAGVSDHPFRRICAQKGADLCYVEMISATALLYESRRTLDMLKRHESEAKLGVQITGPSADEVGRAVAILDSLPFDTIDINMGCPVRKVVKTGCGSAILRDPERVFATVKAACQASAKPISAKIRLGWDHQSINVEEVAQAIAAAGASWLVIHGRTRADDYGVPVDLKALRRVKEQLSIPVIGNGNLFQKEDADIMRRDSKVDGLMLARGALGNPWLFREIKTGETQVSLEDWRQTVLDHLTWQREEYGNAPGAAVCMRKHLLWYAKGWPGVKHFRETINRLSDLGDAAAEIEAFAEQLQQQGVKWRIGLQQAEADSRFQWDPKWDMDRKLDRGVGDEGMDNILIS